jgi:hypothetical protein
MKLTFTRTDANEWALTTDIGDYTIVYDDETDEYTLYFLPATAGSMAKHIAFSIDRGFVEEVASKHYQALKGGSNAIR